MGRGICCLEIVHDTLPNISSGTRSTCSQLLISLSIAENASTFCSSYVNKSGQCQNQKQNNTHIIKPRSSCSTDTGKLMLLLTCAENTWSHRARLSDNLLYVLVQFVTSTRTRTTSNFLSYKNITTLICLLQDRHANVNFCLCKYYDVYVCNALCMWFARSCQRNFKSNS